MPTLLTSQRNDLFKAVQSAALDPRDFTWESRPQSWTGWGDLDAPALVHRTTGFCLVIGDPPPAMAYVTGRQITSSTPRYAVQTTPGEGGLRANHLSLTWPQVIEVAQEWAHLLANEIREVDLWAALDHSTMISLRSSPDASNTPFNAAERDKLMAGLDRIFNTVKATYELTDDQTSALADHISYLREATERVGRKDFILMFGGVLTGWLLQTGLPPDTVRAMWRVAWGILQQCFTLNTLEP